MELCEIICCLSDGEIVYESGGESVVSRRSGNGRGNIGVVRAAGLQAPQCAPRNNVKREFLKEE